MLVDANVLVYAFRQDMEDFSSYRGWLEGSLSASVPMGFADITLTAVVRVLTHPSIFAEPTQLEGVLEYCDKLLLAPISCLVHPGPRHWEIFTGLCRVAHVSGNLVTDAHLAAIAIELGAEVITTDRDFARFPGLRWRHPFK